ncbi:Bug family tripartite tricarboxylate transporter substrate binding protein [Chloroflexota bacterium]
MRKVACCLLAITLVVSFILAGCAPEPTPTPTPTPTPPPPPYYEGKTIVAVAPSTPGGTVDTINRLVAQYLPEYIPGKPTIIVENHPGGGGQIGVRYAYDAKPDGLTTIGFMSTYALPQLFGNTDTDYTKFEYLGCPAGVADVLIMRSELPYRSIEDFRTAPEPIKSGAIGKGSLPYDVPKLLVELAGLNIQIVTGYPGVNEVLLAIQQGEVDMVTYPLPNLGTRALPKEMYDTGYIVPVMWVGGPVPSGEWKAIAEALPDPADFMSAEDRQVWEAYTGTLEGLRVFATTPGTPPAVVEILREALMKTMQDPAFIADAAKVGFDITALDHEETRKYATALVTLPAPLEQKLIEILK